ncbi:MAG: sulfite exporter TauE/SafE family protein, partial [Bacteroidales bacterium]|nr:sulfite exporter TauE/SafE family protein [Bacteroidales bacterium]
MSIELFIILVISGTIVGFINTLAGGGTIISMSLFMLLGLPPVVANGTNRIPVILQNLVSVINFYRDKKLDLKKAIHSTIPVAVGSLLGSSLSIAIH